MTRQQQNRAIAVYQHGMGGLGITSQQITSTVGGSLMATGGVLAVIPGLQIPGAIVAAVGALTSLVGGLFRPDITKIEATRIVDQIEAQVLKPMRASWQALPANQKTVSMQAHYLNIFDQAWNAVSQACSNPALATAGQNCIADRAQGACHYTVDGRTPGNPPDCGNWFVWYRDGIANDPNVIPDPSPISQASDSVSSFLDSTFLGSKATGPAGIPMPLLLGAALFAFALSMD
jgi:hypothetical protein